MEGEFRTGKGFFPVRAAVRLGLGNVDAGRELIRSDAVFRPTVDHRGVRISSAPHQESKQPRANSRPAHLLIPRPVATACAR